MNKKHFHKPLESTKTFALVVWVAGSCLLGLSACQTLKKTDHNKTFQNTTMEASSLKSQVIRAPKQQSNSSILDAGSANSGSVVTTPSQIGRIPVISDPPSRSNGYESNGPAPKFGAKTIDAYVPALPLPDFIDVVFGEMLKTPYVTGPSVANKKDVVQLRSSGTVKAKDFLTLISSALEEYGVRVISEDGTYRILEDKALRSRMPVFIKSRARLRTRSDLRPVIQFVELRALDSNSMLGFLRLAFGERSNKITMTSNPITNYITLSGLPEDVDAALAIIRELDALNYAGRNVRRFTPRYWDVTELTTELERALKTEGWQVSTDPQRLRTISLMPVEYSNDLFVFTNSEEANIRVETWIREFDRPIEGGDTQQIFIYQVKNVDAVDLAETANSVIAESNNPRRQQNSTESRNNSRENERAPSISPSSSTVFTVDPLGNRLIFSGTATDFDRYINLLEQLDTPAPEVLIEVQVAEVTLTDNTNLGVEFFIDGTSENTFFSDPSGVDIQTGGLGLGSAGATISILSGDDIEASINAFATNRQVKVLSTPILTAKSGGSAQIQVGTDVPILTSQGASTVQGNDGSTNIQQSVQYRSTGVILSIEPIVFSDDRIDLTISQEVSSTLDSSSGGISSPTISNRSLTTELSLQDGATAVLGGLIQENYVRSDTGVPLLKDIPIVGQIFSNDSLSLDRTELVVLITAYVLHGQTDKTQFVNRLQNRIDVAIANDDRLVTLLPKNF